MKKLVRAEQGKKPVLGILDQLLEKHQGLRGAQCQSWRTGSVPVVRFAS